MNKVVDQEPLEDEALFGVSDEILEQIKEALASETDARVLELTHTLHAADIADIITQLDPSGREKFIKAIKPSFDGEILAHVRDSVRGDVIDALDSETFARSISELDSDDAVAIIEELDDDKKEEILRTLPKSERALVEKSLSYPEGSAGRLMQREVVCVPPFWIVEEAINFIRDTKGLPDVFYDIFVIDPRHVPLGKISLYQLLRHPLDTPVSEIMDEELHTIPVNADEGDAARSFDHYGLISAPVVNDAGRILGVITVDDVVNVIESEVEEDILHMAKVSPETDFYAPVTTTAYWRARWLIITLANTLLATYVISLFEASIQKITALSFLMTMNAAMGGNSGMQVVTVVVRALATRDLRDADTWKAVWRELQVGVMVGLFCAVVLGAYAAVWQDWHLGLVLFAALVCNMLWASFAGTLLPIVIDRMGMDPAISAGPILTTTTDVVGYSIFLGMATWWLM